jgi:hypothetical protein
MYVLAREPAAPENLAQAVLPGWNFGTIVNLSEENSGRREMRAEIEGIKKSGLPDRVAQLCTDLAALQKEDGKEYDRLRRQLLAALEE